MSADTQWPRFQVFLQERPGAPHQDVGSVHAPDAELALLNARDVFVRRPECVNLWVVPVSAIYSRTAEELAAEENQAEQNAGAVEIAPPSADIETYYVFNKTRTAGTQTQVGQVEAASPPNALQAARQQFSGSPPPYMWWIFPTRRVVQSAPQDIESMFAPAEDKPFRLSTDFHTVSAMHKIKRQK